MSEYLLCLTALLLSLTRFTFTSPSCYRNYCRFHLLSPSFTQFQLQLLFRSSLNIAAMSLLSLRGIIEALKGLIVTDQPAFFRLPAGIRNRIYELVLTQDIHLRHHSDEITMPLSRSNPLSLLLLNRQIYAETRLLPFRFATIIFAKPLIGYTVSRTHYLDYCCDLLRCFQRWQISQIRHVELAITKNELQKVLGNDLFLKSGLGIPGFLSECVLDDGKLSNPSISNAELEHLSRYIADHNFSEMALRSLTIGGTKSKFSPFLRLPAELRLHIYKLVLTQDFSLSCPHSIRVHQTPQPRKGNALSLLQVNRQIYCETRRLPFQLNIITLRNPFQRSFVRDEAFSFLDYFKDLLDSLLGWQKCVIRQLEISITNEEMQKLKGYEMEHGMLNISAHGGIFTERRIMYMHWVLEVCTELASVEKFGHGIAARLSMMTSLKKITIAGTEVILQQEQVRHLQFPPELRAVHKFFE